MEPQLLLKCIVFHAWLHMFDGLLEVCVIRK
jgi:hypothetical protein